jgi:hypothetical protein
MGKDMMRLSNLVTVQWDTVVKGLMKTLHRENTAHQWAKMKMGNPKARLKGRLGIDKGRAHRLFLRINGITSIQERKPVRWDMIRVHSLMISKETSLHRLGINKGRVHKLFLSRLGQLLTASPLLTTRRWLEAQVLLETQRLIKA